MLLGLQLKIVCNLHGRQEGLLGQNVLIATRSIRFDSFDALASAVQCSIVYYRRTFQNQGTGCSQCRCCSYLPIGDQRLCSMDSVVPFTSHHAMSYHIISYRIDWIGLTCVYTTKQASHGITWHHTTPHHRRSSITGGDRFGATPSGRCK